jgi:acyl-coenzyme A synthetase/AMP-(fatty) acid ligase
VLCRPAVNAWSCQDVRCGDVVAWPTSLGWMMGPWLVFAALLNKAAIGLFLGAPTGRPFCQFVATAHVTMLGVIPSIVKAWKLSNATDGLDWSCIRCFSSSGEVWSLLPHCSSDTNTCGCYTKGHLYQQRTSCAQNHWVGFLSG